MASLSILNLWNTWNIRCFVILSLLFQVFLILFAPLRKKIANNHITFLLWLAYLMADWVATFAIGLISHHQGNSSAHGAELNVNGAVQAFWVPFLLLHLGGPDTITALSLADNSLWQRHLLSFIVQASAAIYVFVQVFPNDKSMVVPTILVFLVGVIRNVERILVLNFSSLPTLRESMDPKFSKSSRSSWNDELADYSFSDEEAKLPESIVVKHGYYFFKIFSVFLADLIFTQNQREESLQYFEKVSPLDALRMISVELQFMYELLYTKASVIHSRVSCIFRFIALSFLVVAFILFNRLDRHHLPELDIKITYLLLFGGIALDVMALVKLVFSDWTIGKLCNKERPRKLISILHKLASTTDCWRKTQFAKCKADPKANDTYEILDTSFIFRRWSESISACNLFSELWGESPRKVYKCNQGKVMIASSNICRFPLRMAEKIISFFLQAREIVVKVCTLKNPSLIFHTKYMSKNPFINKLWVFIFNEVKHKSKHLESRTKLREIFEARGDVFLKNIWEKTKETKYRNLLHFVTPDNFDSNILCWHIATEMWFNREESTERKEEREFSKILSDYMFYLLLNQPNVMFAVAGNAQITSKTALADLQILTRHFTDEEERWTQLFKLASETTFDAPNCQVARGLILAKKMDELKEMKWKVMSGVWVEMMTYAATHIRGEVHAQVLSKGGELLAFIWLLMAHFGCFYQHPWGEDCTSSGGLYS